MRVFEVCQVVQYLQDLLDADGLLGDLWITGEVSNFGRSPAGHAYFTLKDAQSQIRCALFRGNARDYLPQNGHAVIAHGRVSLYKPAGTLQVIVDLIRPEGVGELHLKFELLKQRLEAEGLFEPGRKRPLPAFPRRIGLVTSPTGAVIQDIWQVIGRRYPYVELVLAPTPVQGDHAAPIIARAIAAINAEPEVDLIVLARGGGSIEDLWAFNEEVVARAIFASRAPVVSAVGHETDYTIADFVADYRAPTPSAAAETIVPDARVLYQRVAGARHSLSVSLSHRLSEEWSVLDRLRGRLGAARPDPAAQEQVLALFGQKLDLAVANRLAREEHRIGTRRAQLDALSPERTLDRGYAVVTAKGGLGGPLRDPGATRPGDELSIRLSGGTLAAEVARS